MDKASTVELIKLISAGNYTALRVRLKTDDVEETDAIGRTALMVACHEGRDECVKLLLKYKQDINQISCQVSIV